MADGAYEAAYEAGRDCHANGLTRNWADRLASPADQAAFLKGYQDAEDDWMDED